MSGDTSAKRIRELRLEQQSIEWWIADRRADGYEPPEEALAELARVSEALFIETDARAERN